MVSVVVSVETVTPWRSVSREPEGRFWVVSAIAMASPKRATTATVAATRIQTKAFGMKRGPIAPAARQCASSSGAAVECSTAVSSASSVPGIAANAAAARPITPHVSGSSKKPA